MSATLPPALEEYIKSKFFIDSNDCLLIRRSAIIRELITRVTFSKGNSPEESRIESVLNGNSCRNPVIYCKTVQDCREIGRYLQAAGLYIKIYNGQLPDDMKKAIELEWLDSELDFVLIATQAIGAGVHNPLCNTVIFYGLPSHLIYFVQNIGRVRNNYQSCNIHAFIKQTDFNDSILDNQVKEFMKLKQCILGFLCYALDGTPTECSLEPQIRQSCFCCQAKNFNQNSESVRSSTLNLFLTNAAPGPLDSTQSKEVPSYSDNGELKSNQSYDAPSVEIEDSLYGESEEDELQSNQSVDAISEQFDDGFDDNSEDNVEFESAFTPKSAGFSSASSSALLRAQFLTTPALFRSYKEASVSSIRVAQQLPSKAIEIAIIELSNQFGCLLCHNTNYHSLNECPEFNRLSICFRCYERNCYSANCGGYPRLVGIRYCYKCFLPNGSIHKGDFSNQCILLKDKLSKWEMIKGLVFMIYHKQNDRLCSDLFQG